MKRRIQAVMPLLFVILICVILSANSTKSAANTVVTTNNTPTPIAGSVLALHVNNKSIPIAGATYILSQNANITVPIETSSEVTYVGSANEEEIQEEPVVTEEPVVVEEVEPPREILLEEMNKTQYVNSKTGLNIRDNPYDGNIIGGLKYGNEVQITHRVTDTDTWVKIKCGSFDAYVDSSYLQDEKIELPKPKAVSATQNYTGNHLTKDKGITVGPQAPRESFYNMDMSYIVQRLKRKGFSGDYWVREDGVKMFGDYIMVAANFDIYPIGTIVQTSLGAGIVCDTGGFIYRWPTAFDIAVTW